MSSRPRRAKSKKVEDSEDEDAFLDDDDEDFAKASAKKKKKIDLGISAAEFLRNAKPIDVTLSGKKFEAVPKKFSTGSFGWSLTGNAFEVDVDGKQLNTQITLNITVKGSKPAN